MEIGFDIDGSTGIFVYRNPRIQYQQIDYVYKSTGKIIPSYNEFLSELASQYDSIRGLLHSEHNILFISFDKLLNDTNYRIKLSNYFKKKKILEEIQYDFSISISNNESLSALAENIDIEEVSESREKIIKDYHHSFEEKLTRMIGD